jgi:hypothetical protein
MARLAIARDISDRFYGLPIAIVETEVGTVTVRMDKAGDAAETRQLIETLSSLVLGELWPDCPLIVQQLPGSEWGDEWTLQTTCGQTLRIHRDEANEIKQQAALRLAELMLMPNQSLPDANRYAEWEL